MLARVIRVRIDPERTDQAIDLVHERLIPNFLEQSGSLQGYWMINRETGLALTVTCWSDLEALDAATAAAGRVRAEVVEALEALVYGSEVHVVHGLGADEVPMQGEFVHARVTSVEGLPNDPAGRGLALFDDALETHRAQGGFRSVCWLADHATGNGLGITAWKTPQDLAASEASSRKIVKQVEKGLDCTISQIQEFETIGLARVPGEDDSSVDLRTPEPAPV